MPVFDKDDDKPHDGVREKATLAAMLIILGSVSLASLLSQVAHSPPSVSGLTAVGMRSEMATLPQAKPDCGKIALRQTTVDFTPIGSLPANLAARDSVPPCGTKRPPR